MSGHNAQRPLRLLLGAMVLLAVAFTASMVWLWAEHNRSVALPALPGPYPVGSVQYQWTDPSRIDTLASEPDQNRTLAVWIWYPAALSPGELPAPYLPAAWIDARQGETSPLSFLTQNLAKVQTHALADAALATDQSPYPVLIMQPGLGPLITDYTSLAEALASQGYIVVGSDPTYSASVVVLQDGSVEYGTPAGNVPDNASLAESQAILDRLINVWAADDQFVLDQLEELNAADPTGRFTGKLDMQEVGVFGHSFGGATAAQVCSIDARCKAGVDLDGYPYGTVVQQGLPQPFMFVWSEPTGRVDPGWQQAMQDTQAIAAQQPHPHYQITVEGMRHFNFTDYAVLFSPVVKLMGGLGPIDGQRGLEITAEYVRSFFDRYLKHLDAPLLDGPSGAYPEVQFESR